MVEEEPKHKLVAGRRRKVARAGIWGAGEAAAAAAKQQGRTSGK